jgi:hypothetical protein
VRAPPVQTRRRSLDARLSTGKAQRKKELKKARALLLIACISNIAPAVEQSRPHENQRLRPRQERHQWCVQNIACDSTLSRDVDAELEDEIAKIESSADASAEDKSRLADLKKELETIMKKKEDYVTEHPEQRRLVYRGRKTDAPQGEKSGEAPKPQTKRNVFDKNGMPRHPERSIYYDPVLNPYGVAPPGMPYMERGQSIRWCARDAGLKQ